MDTKYIEEETFSYGYPLEQAKKLGSGAFGVVYEITEKNVVVKKGIFEDLLRDVDVLSQVSHPNVIRMDLFAVQNEGESMSIGMPKGESIFGYIDRVGLTGESDTFRRFICELLCALHILHEMGVLHADIKPDNIVVINDMPVIIDFGLAYFLSPLCMYEISSSPASEVCIKGSTIGETIYSPGYRAPEIVPGRFVTSKADIFAMGKTLEVLYMYANREIFHKPGTGTPYIVSNLPIPISDPILRDLLPRMLHPDPDKREEASLLMRHQYFNGVRDLCSKGIRYIPSIQQEEVISSRKQLIDIFYTVCEWVITTYIQYKVDIRVLFLTLHNIHRTLHLADKKTLQLIAAVNMQLANIEFRSSMVDIDLYLPLISYTTTRYQFLKKRSSIIATLGGIVTVPTYWDMAKSGEEIIPLLIKTIRWDYTGSSTISKHGYKYSKWIDCTSLSIWNKNNKPFIQYMNQIEQGIIAENDIDNILYDPKPITYIPTPVIPTLNETVREIASNPLSALRYVYEMLPLMEQDKIVANTILNTLMNIKEKNRYMVEAYDIIFGRKKLTLWGKNIKSLKINAYTASYEAVVDMLNI